MIVSNRYECVLALKVKQDVRDFLINASEENSISCMMLLELLSIFPSPYDVICLIDKIADTEEESLFCLQGFIFAITKYVLEGSGSNINFSECLSFIREVYGDLIKKDTEKTFSLIADFYFSDQRLVSIFGENK